MDNSLTEVKVQEVAIFKQPGCGSKVWGDFAHVGPITDSVCCAKVLLPGHCLGRWRSAVATSNPSIDGGGEQTGYWLAEGEWAAD